MGRTNRHHLCFEAASWECKPDLLKIRRMGAMIVRLDEEVHSELHKAVITVPTPDRYMARRILRDFEPGRGILQTMDNFMFTVQEAMQHPLAGEIEKGLGGLIIQAFELQKPFILDGIKVP